jgi:hypothetical protein
MFIIKEQPMAPPLSTRLSWFPWDLQRFAYVETAALSLECPHRGQPGGEFVLHDGAGTVGFGKDPLVTLPALPCNVVDPPFLVEVGILRCQEVR